MISFKCGSCGAGLKVSDDKAGKKGKCPKCGGAIQVPSISAPSVLNVEHSPQSPEGSAYHVSAGAAGESRAVTRKSIEYRCAKCGAALVSDPDLIGKLDECPGCRTRNVVPDHSHRLYGIVWFSLLYWGGFALIVIPFVVVVHLLATQPRPALWRIIVPSLAVFLGMLCVPGAFIIGLVKLYRAWKVVQPLRVLDPAEAWMPSAGTALALMFVPLLNIPWSFVAIRGLARRVNRFLVIQRSPFRGMSERLAALICVLNCCAGGIGLTASLTFYTGLPLLLLLLVNMVLVVPVYLFVLQMNRTTEIILNYFGPTQRIALPKA